ncbi:MULTISPECIES: hypothetical protein [unclassified Bacillus (in: firmicutes)]|uniref:hypothetical protein n=1 Tax=unclassified Bacillus (in: firmicutes) TaxID=185979 RepID=UPI0008EC2CF2|nr:MULTISPECIES: hypothetical protein [unclassified Bacillus (in: firmicutes)]SFA90800.1 hypothetical protein SAMN02799634_102513 [Bacillus sp. UNCCL13]SFQ85386.1 hypothetical protein SAMN04488577_2633 [Bacillus sp. cl95]
MINTLFGKSKLKRMLTFVCMLLAINVGVSQFLIKQASSECSKTGHEAIVDRGILSINWSVTCK